MAAKAQPTLLEYAVDGASAASHLATGLAHAGADQKIVQTVQQCATILHQAAKALGSGPSLDQGGQQAGPPEGSPAEEAAETPAQERAEQAAGTDQPQAPPKKNRSAHHAMLAAAHATQAAMAAAQKK